MAEKKWADHILIKDEPSLDFPVFRPEMDTHFAKRVLHLDAGTVPGAEFYSEAMWILPGAKTELTEMKSHTHTWGEFIGFFGFNYEDIQDLGAEIEFTVNNQKYFITKSFGAYIPAGIQHGPLIIKNVVRPIFHFMAGPTKMYE